MGGKDVSIKSTQPLSRGTHTFDFSRTTTKIFLFWPNQIDFRKIANWLLTGPPNFVDLLGSTKSFFANLVDQNQSEALVAINFEKIYSENSKKLHEFGRSPDFLINIFWKTIWLHHLCICRTERTAFVVFFNNPKCGFF